MFSFQSVSHTRKLSCWNLKRIIALFAETNTLCFRCIQVRRRPSLITSFQSWSHWCARPPARTKWTLSSTISTTNLKKTLPKSRNNSELSEPTTLTPSSNARSKSWSSSTRLASHLISVNDASVCSWRSTIWRTRIWSCLSGFRRETMA